MNWDTCIELLEVHCEGEIGKVVIKGQPEIPGNNLGEKFRWLSDPDNSDLRRFLVLEPRGDAAGSVNLLFPPDDPNNHAGFIVLQPDQAHAMSGSNAICVTTAVLEHGIVEMIDGENEIRLETAAGLVIAKAHCMGGKCEHVTLSMPASFVEKLDHKIETKEWGTLKTDIAYGGVFYALLNAEDLGLKIDPSSARQLVNAGIEIKNQLNQELDITHPQNPDIKGIAYVMFREKQDDGAIRTCTIMWPGRIDRSPCGTGNSANLATRFARGEVDVGDEYTSRSTIGSEFKVRLNDTAQVGDKQAVLPQITGRGFIYAKQIIPIGAADPFPKGFAVSDTWGPDAGKIRGG